MRIIYLTTSPLLSERAHAVQIAHMCQSFSSLGHDLTVIAPTTENDQSVTPLQYAAHFGLLPFRNCEIITIPRWSVRGALWRYALQAVLQARRLAPDLVYTRSALAAGLCHRWRLPMAWEAHALPLATSPTGAVDVLACRYFLSTRRPKLLVPISGALSRDLRDEFSMRAVTTVVAHDGATPIADDAEPMPLGGDAAFEVGYIGSTYPGKGVELIVRLARACPWARFHVVGGTASDAAERFGALPANMVWHGRVDHAATKRFALAFDALLAPYAPVVMTNTVGGANIAAWMSPLKVFEYMAAAKPILASDLPVLREVLHHGQNALLCDPDRVDDWSERLSVLRDDAALRARLGQAAREDFLAHYTWDARAARIVASVATR